VFGVGVAVLAIVTIAFVILATGTIAFTPIGTRNASVLVKLNKFPIVGAGVVVYLVGFWRFDFVSPSSRQLDWVGGFQLAH
jgi:predicted membrane channel-forming protein YqfA (hemolysin III family)